MQTSQIVLQTVADMWIILAISVAFGSIFVSNPLRKEKKSDLGIRVGHEGVADAIVHFRTMAKTTKSKTMMLEIEMQFIEMAQGGDGSIAQMGNIREEYYNDKEDTFFQAVCDAFGWDRVTPADEQF